MVKAWFGYSNSRAAFYSFQSSVINNYVKRFKKIYKWTILERPFCYCFSSDVIWVVSFWRFWFFNCKIIDNYGEPKFSYTRYTQFINNEYCKLWQAFRLPVLTLDLASKTDWPSAVEDLFSELKKGFSSVEIRRRNLNDLYCYRYERK